MLCYGEEFEVEWNRLSVLQQIILFRGPLLSACRFAEFDTSIVCRVLIISFGSFQYCKMCFKFSKYWLWMEKV